MNFKMKPGEIVTEVSLSGKLGISRTSVRDAIRRLENEGLIITQNRSKQIYLLNPLVNIRMFHLSETSRQLKIPQLGVLIVLLLLSCMLFSQEIPFQEDFREGFREQSPWYEVATTVHWEQNWVTWGSKYGKDESGGLLVQSIMRSVVVLLGSPVYPGIR